MKTINIIGASGHGKVIADIAKLNGYDNIVFFDDDQTLTECAGYPVSGSSREAAEGDIFVAIGNGEIRKKMMDYYSGRRLPALIHPEAVVAESASVGPGTVIMAGAVVNPYAVIGRGCIVNTSSSVDHDSIVEDFVHVAVGAHLCGTVTIGQMTWIGAGTVVSNNINICNNCMIGAGAVVVHDITEPGTYVGVPAKLI